MLSYGVPEKVLRFDLVRELRIVITCKCEVYYNITLSESAYIYSLGFRKFLKENHNTIALWNQYG